MAIIRHQPNVFIREFQNEINRLFDNNLNKNDNSAVETSEWLPAVDIKEEANRFIILADIPGVDPKEIEIHMENGILTIKGEKKYESKTEKQGYHRIERASGIFYRRFTLPETADAENIQAKGKNGVLEIIVPKVEPSRARKIEVQSE